MAEVMLLLLLLLGIILLFHSTLAELLWNIKNILFELIDSIRDEEKNEKEDPLEEKNSMPKEKDWIWMHIKKLLQITYGFGTDRGVRCFAILSGLLAAIVFTILCSRVNMILSTSATAVSIILPYSILRLKLQKIRIETSREGEILISELYENYKINYFNMQRAIEITGNTIEEAKNSKRLLLNLSRSLNSVGSKEGINKALSEFKYSINTSWANILAVNMSFALSNGIDVSEALADLLQIITKARLLDEYERRENNESKLMINYLAPICYLMTVLGGIFYFKLSLKEFIYYQFRTSAGVTWITISIIFYIVGTIGKGFITRTKLDL